MALQQVANVYSKEETNKSSVYTMGFGEEIKYYQIPAYNDPNFLNSSLSHLWSFFSMRTETDYNTVNRPFANGGLLNTAIEKLPEAFWSNGMVGFSIPNDNYRVQIDGKNIALYIPLNSSYTGMTSGLTATTLYSSFVYSVDNLKKSPTSLCAGVTVDTYKSEAAYEYTNNFGIGYKYVVGKNPVGLTVNQENYPYFDSGVVYLVSDSVYNTFSGATGSSTSWSYQYNNDLKYSLGARTISFEGSNTQYTGVGGYDRVVGAMFLNYGIGFIFDPDLVKGFDWSTVNGDPTSLTGGTFTSGQTAYNAADLDLAETLVVKVIADENTFKSTTNSSYMGLGSAAASCGIATTTITLHNQTGDCLAIAKPDAALIKQQGQYLIFDLSLPVSGPIQDSLADTRGLIWNGTSAL